MTRRRAQILRLHARGVPAVEICARLLVSWQVVARVLRQAQDEAAGAPNQVVVDNSLNGGEPPFEAASTSVRPVEVPPLAGRRQKPSHQHLVDRALAEGRVTKCPPAYGAPVEGAAPVGPLPHYTPHECRPGGWRAKAAAVVAARERAAGG